ncbi:interleukin-18 receptor 1-like [Nematolebias whitei]|uniref:interleukin-18 receptor 1-like n=1 Tax=Nematolebias whitei TaxID=451745 RepID=UPI0018971201|nr:interleukin-18 receptor 1-like [Nematolebias whitei]
MAAPLLLLLLLLTFITGVHPLTWVNVKVGDMVELHCGSCELNDSVTLWRRENEPTVFLYSNMSAAEQDQLGVIVHQNVLVILSTSENHGGNYSCTQLGNTSNQSWFLLRVYSTQSKEYDKKYTYDTTCYTQKACTLVCPTANRPEVDIPNLTSTGITWHKNGELSEGYFPSIEEKNSGVYICTWSYLYSGQTYNRSFIMILDVLTEKHGASGISSPQDGQVFHVELDTTVVITCKAVPDSCRFNSLFWLSDDQFVEDDQSCRVFNNFTCNDTSKEMAAFLVFNKVQEEDLSKNFTCKFESDQRTAFTTITLTQIARPSYITVAACTVIIVAVMAAAVVIYMKFKVDIALYFRDTLGCRSSSSDGKSYDAFLMCYKSDADGGLDEDDRRWLERTLEEQFGYKLCLYDRDVIPGQAQAEAVLDSVGQSRAVVLVPCSPDPGPGTALLSAIHAALVERRTRLVFIDTAQTEGSRSSSLAEALQLLSEAGDCITWRGRTPSSSSSFWKQLRYHLPAPQRAQKQMYQLLP